MKDKNMFKEGDTVVAIFPNGETEVGTIVKIRERLALDEENLNIYTLDGGFPEGTKFELCNAECDAEEEHFIDEELEGVE